ncbi:protein-disulfide reductase DsbD family protein [Sphingosinicella sp.]|uniref:protein-disulfide reductase DsbD family protein n=1 Tax=Sphingosinicella sp. TaxID=1917971 RepID=UPI0040382BDD
MTRAGALLILLCALLVGAPAAAQRRMDVSLVPETANVLPGTTLTVAFVMRPGTSWHGYWRNPGDAGAEPRVRWRLPEGWQAGPLQYPAPDRLIVMGLMNYVFERDYALLATIRVPADAEPGVASPIDARLEYLVCTNEVCVPEEADVSVEVATRAPGRPNPAFAAYRQALPRPLQGEGRFEATNGRIRLAIPVPAGAALSEPYFFPATSDALSHAAPQTISRNGDVLVIETGAGPSAVRLGAIEGVIELAPGVALALTARPGPVPPAGATLATVGGGANAPPGADNSVASGGSGDGAEASILLALLGALAGGLILNVMPCVFPILSLKALSLARAGADEGTARREALAYSAGAVLICLALGGALLILRAAGVAAGWAFQLQDPRIILVLLLLVIAIALNLAGLFRLPTLGGGDALTGQSGARGAFFTGALAAFVATPCTGPFLGFALGAALVLPAWAALAVFAGLGLGLAFPFLLLGFIPALRSRLPKPGVWMERFQRLLAAPMLLTALGLAWVLGRQTGVDGMALGLGAALLLGLGLWWLGRRQDGRSLWPAFIVIALAVVAPLPFIQTAEGAPVAEGSALGAEPFSEARLAALRASGPVFVYFTADWCLTCKVNERAVLDRAEVAEHFRARGVRTLVGDWTRGDPAITRFLARHGRSGVPLYLYYAPGREAEVLPQLLTVGTMTSLGG